MKQLVLLFQGNDYRLGQGLSEDTEETQHVFSGLGAISDRLPSWNAWSQKVFKSQNVSNKINDVHIVDGVLCL